MRILIILCVFIIFGCKNKVKEDSFKVDIINTKDILKDEIIIKFLNLPITDLSINNIKFNNYPVLKQLDSLFLLYNKQELSVIETENLQIVKAKRFLLTANYEKALKELNNLPNSDYKNLLLGISFELQGDSLSAKKYFNSLYLKINSLDDNISDCQKYLIMSALLEKGKLEQCKHLSKAYSILVKTGKAEIIRTHFLSSIEL